MDQVEEVKRKTDIVTLVGERVKMHTLVVFLAIMGGLNLFGILGIIYGPLIATAFLTLTDIYYASYQKLIGSDME